MWRLLLAGGLGVFLDWLSSQLCLKYPELYEANPHFNPVLEALTLWTGTGAIFLAGDKLGASRKVSTIITSIPISVPYLISVSNFAQLAVVKSKEVNWNEISLLYMES